jgi:hypothetical protein
MNIDTNNRMEVWGTYSVRDHLRKRPFVADVILYDKLVIPRPPTPEEEPPKSGDTAQKTRWGVEGWKPGRLARLLDILRERELAIEIPWDNQSRQDWKEAYHGSAAGRGERRCELVDAAAEAARIQTPGEDKYIATGGVLAKYVSGELRNAFVQRLIALEKPAGVPVEPVIAYGSYKAFEREQSMKKASVDDGPDNLCPYALFGWTFFVPEDTDKTDAELLREAAKLASRADLRETRQSFHYWLKQVHAGGVDAEAAQVKMLKMLKEYRAIVRGSGVRRALRFAAKAAPVVAPIAHIFLSEGFAIAGDVVAGGATLVVDALVPNIKPDARVRPAAIVYEARRFFGKKIN